MVSVLKERETWSVDLYAEFSNREMFIAQFLFDFVLRLSSWK